MKNQSKHFLILLFIVTLFSGCGVGSLVAVPFKVTGAVVNVVTPEIVGDTISGTGDVIEDTIPF